MNPYEILGVEKNASIEEIQRAWRKKSSKAHPDRNGGDTKLQEQLNVARDLLIDKERRRRYDERGDTSVNPPDQAAEYVKDIANDLLRHGLEDNLIVAIRHRVEQ